MADEDAPLCRGINCRWVSMVDLELPPSQWHFECRDCSATTAKPPAGARSPMSTRELEAMVDSSLRVADKVVTDDQSLRGELWTMRNAIWTYWPFQFQIVYHLLGGEPFTMLFHYRNSLISGLWTTWKQIRETKDYQKLLTEADIARVARSKAG